MGSFLIAGLIISALGTAASIVQGQMAAEEQEKAAEVQRSINASKQQREREQLLREARIKRAQVRQQAENQGAGESSGTLGAISSISNQAGSELGFLTQQGQAMSEISASKKRQASFEESSTTWGSVAKVGSTMFSYSDKLESLF